ncbi:MAG: UDP-N-acetylmuramoyl-L-alanine--D-glutamate ligase, partial [Acetatifactor sp.]|nr:UDP-N-acetylmuramoyl-L-alanine--D-glutamate ligase [Acetatifactor sp.]
MTKKQKGGSRRRERIMLMKDKKCLVIGSGISGVGSVGLLEHMGARVVLYDSSEKLTPKDLRSRLPEDSKAVCVTGKPDRQVLEGVEAVVLSPGVPVDIPLVKTLQESGARIMGEIELGYQEEKGRVAAITGTNGKTTTTTLVGEIMKAWLGGEKVFVVGNIGNPYTSECRKTSEETVTVGEISSFQLETIRDFHPRVSAILNITPDHLDRHHTMEAYVAAKENVTLNQTKEDICVLNYENEFTRAFGARCPARVVFFSSVRELGEGYYLKEGRIFKSGGGQVQEILDTRELKLVGICNMENVMAALAIAEGMGAPQETVLSVVRSFRAVEH